MNSDTKICVSIAARPGQFGIRFHNSAYRLFDLNCAYISLRVRAEDTEPAVRLVRDNFHGCSLSMPHKIRAMEFADVIHETALRSGAANTLLKAPDGTLTAFNTDLLGTQKVLESRDLPLSGRSVLLLGAGGVARAIAVALADAGARLIISNRTIGRAEALARQLKASVLRWEDRMVSDTPPHV
jgi:shikimate dehydrogenase